MILEKSTGYKQVIRWLKRNKKKPFKFQTDAWQYYAEGYSGLVNAPTGFGKTFSMFLAVVIDELNDRETIKTNAGKAASAKNTVSNDSTVKAQKLSHEKNLKTVPSKTSPAKKVKKMKGLRLIWITPLRSLAKDLARAMTEVCSEL
ncbi:MAG TPA: DEAD/DEAH box helicase, partial [Pedobacter sp.]